MRSPSASLARHLCAAGLCSALLLAGCGGEGKETPPCTAGMPRASELLADPAFASLRNHKRVEYEIRRGVGYDLWGDSRFEYRAGLEFELVPAKGARNDDDLCVQAIALRLAEPGDDAARKRMVGALARAVAEHSALDAPKLTARVVDTMGTDAKYHLLAREGPVSMSAGRVAHPTRGDFFVVTFSWAP